MAPYKHNRFVSRQYKYYDRQYNLDGYGSPVTWLDRKIYRFKLFLKSIKQLFSPVVSKLATTDNAQQKTEPVNNSQVSKQNIFSEKDTLNNLIKNAKKQYANNIDSPILSSHSDKELDL